MEYDYSVYESSIEPYYDKLYENEVYADVSNKGCILDKRGICGGISIILSELCNRVGITAYPVFGTIKSDGTLIPHGWVAMRVDDSTYYIDPTYVCQTGEMDNLKMKMKWNALETDSISLRIHLSIRQALREYMIAVGKNTTYRKIMKNYVWGKRSKVRALLLALISKKINNQH